MSLDAAVVRLSSALTGRYVIERELGQGGMATVYLAHDVRHDRKVALKVLRPELAAILGGERFLKEIRTTANLQHPHILALHDSGEAEGLVYYVMPYVEGESLRDRLNREKQLPVDDAVRITSEVADALDYAHRHGVIHRDIKPENILVHGGHAQVADFGIALAASRSEGSTRMTETGMSLGTPQYMSPEQAMGEREISPKSDIYALGCVAYEMLTGEAPFTGPTAQAIVARVMTDQPRSITAQRHTVPMHVEAAVRQALEKLPADRFGTAREFAEALAGRGDGGTVGRAAATAIRPAVPLSRRPSLFVAGAFLLGALLAWLVFGQRAPSERLRMSMTLPMESPPVAVRLSPDGRMLAYAAAGAGDRTAVYTRRVDELGVHRLDGTDDAVNVSFSPDGSWIAFSTLSQARRVLVGGGSPVPIAAKNNIGIQHIEFAGPNRYVITTGAGSLATLEEDGTAHVFAPVDSAHAPFYNLDQVLPNGLVLARPWMAPPNGPVVIYDPNSGDADTVVSGANSWSGYSNATLAWAIADGTVYAAPFSLRRRKLTGSPTPIGVSVLSILGFTPPASFGNGTLVYAPTRPRALVSVNRAGVATIIQGIDRTYHSPRVSPNGRTLAFDFTDQQRDTWLFDLADSTLTRFGFDSTAHDPTWLPDGSGLVFATIRGGSAGVGLRRFAGGPRAEVLAMSGSQISVHAVTPDGKTGVAARISPAGEFDLIGVHLDGSKRLDTLLATSYNEGFPALSPDGHWLAYASDESGRYEVYVRSFPGMTSKVQVSQDGGTEPVWARSGREIFYRSGGAAEPRLVAASVEAGSAFRVTGRRPLFSVASYEFATPHADYDVFPGDQSFVMVRQGRPGQAAEVMYVQGVPDLARRRNR